MHYHAAATSSASSLTEYKSQNKQSILFVVSRSACTHRAGSSECSRREPEADVRSAGPSAVLSQTGIYGEMLFAVIAVFLLFGVYMLYDMFWRTPLGHIRFLEAQGIRGPSFVPVVGCLPAMQAVSTSFPPTPHVFSRFVTLGRRVRRWSAGDVKTRRSLLAHRRYPSWIT